MNIRENIPLAPLTTFKIGGPARYLVDVQTEGEIRETLAWAREKRLPFFILAGKSNVLVPDEGLEGIVIHIVGNSFAFSKTELQADAGCSLLSLIREASKRGLGGWEKLSGIPGTLGGAVRGNAGAFGPEIKDFVVRVRALNAETGDMQEFTNAECDFSYRMSYFKLHPEWIITGVRLELEQVEQGASETLIEETIKEREKRHIQNVQAAGSYFMNPVVPKKLQQMFEKEKNSPSRGGRVPAGWLIEKAGMKGARVGDAVASEQHPNYLKNDGGASAAQVKELAQKIKNAVREQFNVELQEEAVIL